MSSRTLRSSTKPASSVLQPVQPVQRMPAKEAMPKTVKGLFDRYANHPKDISDGVEGKIGPNGVQRLLEDLQMESDDRRVVILLQRCNPEKQCEFSWEEWQKGMTGLGANSVESLRNRLDNADKGLRDVQSLAPVYKFIFDYGKAPGQRTMGVDIAVQYWEILFKDEYSLLPLWLQFMGDVNKKAVTKDVWNQMLEFATTVKTDFSDYDEEASWPSVFDEFVKWAKPRLPKA